MLFKVSLKHVPRSNLWNLHNMFEEGIASRVEAVAICSWSRNYETYSSPDYLTSLNRFLLSSMLQSYRSRYWISFIDQNRNKLSSLLAFLASLPLAETRSRLEFLFKLLCQAISRIDQAACMSSKLSSQSEQERACWFCLYINSTVERFLSECCSHCSIRESYALNRQIVEQSRRYRDYSDNTEHPDFTVSLEYLE